MRNMTEKKKKKDLIKAEKNNQNKELVSTEDRLQIAEAICQAKGLSKTLRYLVFRVFKFPIKEAAKLAGIAENTAYCANVEVKQKGYLADRLSEIVDPSVLPDAYRDWAKLNLLDIAEIEGGAMEEYRKKPKLAIEKPALLKHLKQAGGVLVGEDVKVEQVNIDYKAIHQILDQRTQQFLQEKGRGDEVIEAEAVEAEAE